MKLASKLKNKIEVWGNKRVKNELGAWDNEPKFIKKIHADIIPRTGSTKEGVANTEYADTKFKIRIRSNVCEDLTEQNWIVYKEKRYNIEYILPDYNNQEYIDLFCNVVTE